MKHGEHAIVIGASMGGLVAAAALAPSYSRITVIDRDALPADPAHRRGVPQSKHAHGFQPGGLRALDDLLPGVVDELISGGAAPADLSGTSAWFIGGGRLARTQSGVRSIGMTRPYLEHTVRARVAALPNVTIRDHCEVTSLVSQPQAKGGARVVGIELRSAVDDATIELAADLVVDASGRVSKLPEWLAELGYAAAAEEQVHCKMAYLSARWKLTNDVVGDDGLIVVAPAEVPFFGVVIKQEDGTHIVTVGGLLDGAPEKNEAAYLAFARALPDERIADALTGAERVTDLQPSHFPYSRRRRYDKLRSFPAGLLALGDSIASFNPMYGQGMSVAALQAVALRDALAAGPLNTAKYFRQAHRIEDVAWKVSTGGDLRYDGVEGKRTPDVKIMNGYLDRLTLAARTDPELAVAFLKVAAFINRPESLFKPSIVRRALRGARAARRAGEPAVQHVPGVLANA